MQKLRALTDLIYKDKKVSEGMVFESENNDAHSLIDHGFVELVRMVEVIEDRMLTPKRRKGYITK